MSRPAYAPYATSFRPFTIGLAALDPRRLIEPDGTLRLYLDEKEEIARNHRHEIFRATEDSLAAQQECLDLILAHLEQYHRDTHRRRGDVMEVAGRRVELCDPSLPPLMRAGFLVQDDLVLMRRRQAGWSITAAHLSFPSSWRLAEKFDRPMEEVHATVPGFAGGTRNAAMINRIFDNLAVDRPAVRFNWSINWKQKLFHPESGQDEGATPQDAVVRVERQTLSRLPVSGDLLFTIRIYLDPVAGLSTSDDAGELMHALADQLDLLTPEQAGYKSLGARRGALIATLRAEAERLGFSTRTATGLSF
ncbi:DUF3445 domain-containing protein [Rhizobium sp. SSA_523]|uniref:heme-dependent oxidative N-demethylase family protein n=1 Tax=Rhizobium sp. SSA_523 TaxID=2952477 RepID=UPI0020913642|nr:DUF3445 domain-containing protein [Rhizobium sp. SSA_523]MCO5731939.1 DUF3445 domain-containing protein [Rhizobium sp. SSA_523]WKC22710.1 DUF3445 domain-containing protein [Rhizobium sp. SSA_523]